MTYNKNNDLNTNLIIRAHGFGFIFLCTLLFIMLIACVFIISTAYIWFNNLFNLAESVFGLIIIIIFTPLLIQEIYNLFKRAKVEFNDNIFLTIGQNKNIFPRIEQDCKNFIAYKLTSKYAAQCLEFTFVDGKKILFHTMQFSKKQNLQILNEIKKRGGFPNQEIKFDHYYI